MRIAVTAAGLLLVAGGAAACGDDGDKDGGKDGGGKAAGASVSVDDFCAAFQSFYDDLQEVSEDADNLGKVLKDAAQQIEDVGTPDDIPADAKEGLQLTLDAIDDLPDDASSDEVFSVDSKFTDEEQEKVDAFSDYLEKTCPETGDSGGDTPDDTSTGSGSDPASESTAGGS